MILRYHVPTYLNHYGIIQMLTRNTAAVETIKADIEAEFKGQGMRLVTTRKPRGVVFKLEEKRTGFALGWVNVLNSELNKEDTKELSVFVVDELKEACAY